MKLIINGNVEINKYYAQTLCMIFFPGAKFSETEEITDTTPVVTLVAERLEIDGEQYIRARAEMRIGTQAEVGEDLAPAIHERFKLERIIKVAVGVAVFSAGRAFFGNTPPWGILTGVRPSKMATELIADGLSYTQVRRALKNEYFVNPKKASLAADVAFNEARLLRGFQSAPKTCSLYISIPFCPTRCAYCSFVSYSTPRLLSLIPEYLIRLCSDIRRMAQTIKQAGYTVATIYIGGGTPTTLDEKQLDILLSTINECFDVPSLAEFTLEAGRPDTVTPEKLSAAKNHGVSRVSINPQTLEDDILESIGRRHTARDFYTAYDIARSSGIKTINTDVIAGLPGDRFSTFSRTVDSIISLDPENITFHTFCVKKSADILREGTEIYNRGEAAYADTGKCVDYSQLRAKNAGYIPYYMYRQKNTVGNYENVGFSKPGHEGLYNIFIMEEIHTIFACGAGAVTKMLSPRQKPDDGAPEERMKRMFMPKYPYEYLAMDDAKIDEFFGGIADYCRS
ncbi:MAG: coproporphyrinogen dehydrogenase HemZ [Eubacteriales bacterium]